MAHILYRVTKVNKATAENMAELVKARRVLLRQEYYLPEEASNALDDFKKSVHDEIVDNLLPAFQNKKPYDVGYPFLFGEEEDWWITIHGDGDTISINLLFEN